MNRRPSPFSIGLFALLALPACLETEIGSGENGENSGDSGDSSESVIFFSGATEAIPLTPELVLVTWLTATNDHGDSPESMVYTLYRGDTEDFDILTTSTEDTFELQGAPTGNPSLAVPVGANATHFFKVQVTDSHETLFESVRVVSAHTPKKYVAGTLDYVTDVVPHSWESSVDNGSGPVSCLDCHDGSNPKSSLNLTSFENLMIGTGTAVDPMTFVVPGSGSDTAGIFWLSFDPLHPDHTDFAPYASLIHSFLEPWADQGALKEPDNQEPVFRFDVPGHSGLYTATPDWVAETVDIQFFHASDPESELIDPTVLYDQLNYRIYGGVDSNSIDWLTPVAYIDFTYSPMPTHDFTGSFLLADDSYTETIDWPHSTGVFVVRAVDFLGNESINEVELTIQR